jgi:probable HAF family extracellular repeat protein
MSKFLKFVGLLYLMQVGAISSFAAVEYTVNYLGKFSPLAINNYGDVVGNYGNSGVYYRNGSISLIPTLGGSWSYATDLNDNGEIVGSSLTGDGIVHAFHYREGSMNDLGTFGGQSSSANSINNSGKIAANYTTSNGKTYGLLYDHGSTTEIGTFGGDLTVAYGINDRGEIVGHASVPDGLVRAFVWKNGIMTDLGSLGGDTFAEAINNAGQIVGYSYIPGEYIVEHAFLYTNGNLLNISGTSDISMANAINNRGDVVGSYTPKLDAFIYRDGRMTDLNELINPSLGLHLTFARDINDRGQILLTGAYDNESLPSGVFVLTPIPEPPSFILMVCGIVVAFCVSQRFSRGIWRVRNALDPPQAPARRKPSRTARSQAVPGNEE